jgi:hypothetical protein
MLGARHFDEFGSPKNWDDLVREKIVVQCKCGKWIWAYWYKGDYNKATQKYDRVPIDKCAPCYFKENDSK